MFTRSRHNRPIPSLTLTDVQRSTLDSSSRSCSKIMIIVLPYAI